MRYPRDMLGYGSNPPNPLWPGGAHIAVQFALNYEEGGESNILHGDAASESILSELVGAQPWPGQRHWNMESLYGYGSRAGFWRLYRLFTARQMPLTVYGVATALRRSPAQVAAMLEAKWEIASHGLKWIDYKDYDTEHEREHLHEAISVHKEVTGARPTGWYCGRPSINTIDLVSEEGGFTYVSDAYDDDLPYWREHFSGPQLVIPYAFDSNDMRFASPQGFNSGDQFFAYLKDSFDTLYDEGKAGMPKMMSVGLHCRLAGRPGRIAALARFIDYVQSKPNVWIARRIDIAEHWLVHHPYEKRPVRPSALPLDDFTALYGGIFEHSEWIAERTFKRELGPANDTASGLCAAMVQVFRGAGDEERLAVLKAQPDLVLGKPLSEASAGEQASVGLNALTEAERKAFSALGAAYLEKFGFPFIIALKDNTKATILSALDARLKNDRNAELAAAAVQLERIALLRLRALLPE